MTEPQAIDADKLLLMLRRKEGTWVDWGHACAQLQKAGQNPQAIFEATGFEPIQQNQIIVAAQVFDTMTAVGVAPATQEHYNRVGSDSLYELRILTKEDRAAAADFLHSRNIDSTGSREVAKAFKEFAFVNKLPEGFSHHPGDAVAYQYWRYAKQQTELAEKSRLIARGLMFAHSQSARNQIEKLLTELSPQTERAAPSIPIYRLESEEEVPCILPIAGTLPLDSSILTSQPPFVPVGRFGIAQGDAPGGWISLPGWQVLLLAEDPTCIMGKSNELAIAIQGEPEEIAIVIERAETEWNELDYFAVDRDGKVSIEWLPTDTQTKILGKLLMILRPKRSIETASKVDDIWKTEE
jgi:hypothetical protein